MKLLGSDLFHIFLQENLINELNKLPIKDNYFMQFYIHGQKYLINKINNKFK